LNPQRRTEDFDRFTDFMRKLVAVPHDTIKARLEAEKAEKKKAAKGTPSTAKG